MLCNCYDDTKSIVSYKMNNSGIESDDEGVIDIWE